MTLNKLNDVLYSTIFKVNDVLLSTVSYINGVLVSIGGWDLYNAIYNLEYGSITARENINKSIYFKPDGTRFYVVGEDSFTTGTNGYLTGGTAAQSNYATWEAVTDGSFGVTIDGIFYNISGIDFTGVTDMDDVASVIQTAIRNVTEHLETCVWSTDHFIISSVLGDSDSEISVLSTIVYGTIGTDISGVDNAWMDGETGVGTTTAGTSTFGGHRLQEYILSIPWDVTTLRYNTYYDLNGSSPSVDDCKGLIFSSDGYRVFVANAWEGTTNPERYYSYTMSTAWDLSTLSYDSKSYDFSSDGINCHGLAIKSDGTKLWACDYGVDGDSTGLAHIIQYTFSTAWDLSTLSKDVAELDLSSEMTYCNSFFINAAGTRIFATEKEGGNEIHQYNLSTPYDLSSGSYASKTLNYQTSPTDTELPYGIFVSADGYYLYLCNIYNDRLYKIRLEDSWELNNAYMLNWISVVSQTTDCSGIVLSADGTKMYISQYSGYIYEYDLSMAHDIRSAVYNSVSFNFSGTEANCRNMQINDDGTKLYIVGSAGDNIYEIDMSTPYDLSTASYTAGHYIDISSIVGGSPLGVCFLGDGTKMYVSNNSENVYQYSLSTAWDVTSASSDSKSYSFSSQDSDSRGIAMSTDGSKFYIVGDTNNCLYQYDLGTIGDISTCVYNKSFYSTYHPEPSPRDSQPRAIFFKATGKTLYLAGISTDKVWQIEVH